jgi:hypothetical protein
LFSSLAERASSALALIWVLLQLRKEPLTQA